MCIRDRDVSYAVVETNGSLSAALRPEKETATLADLQLKVEHSHATIPFVLDGQVLEENLHWCGKDQDWLERTAQANTCLLYTSTAKFPIRFSSCILCALPYQKAAQFILPYIIIETGGKNNNSFRNLFWFCASACIRGPKPYNRRQG